MRGKGSKASGIRFSHRITPAYAGKSVFAWGGAHGARDHPRLCGEKRVLRGSTPQQLGSPPPMRGKVPSMLYHISYCRITPAYAGKRHSGDACRPLLLDHPRLCGEKAARQKISCMLSGSPPPMRGKANNASYERIVARITPAYAGKRYQSDS